MIKVTGPTYLTGELVLLTTNCQTCGKPMTKFRDRALHICQECLASEKIEVSALLVVPAPTANTRWN